MKNQSNIKKQIGCNPKHPLVLESEKEFHDYTIAETLIDAVTSVKGSVKSVTAQPQASTRTSSPLSQAWMESMIPYYYSRRCSWKTLREGSRSVRHSPASAQNKSRFELLPP